MRANSTTPSILLVAVSLFCVLVFAVVVGIAMSMPRLGLKLMPGPDHDGVIIVASGPGTILSAPIAPFAELVGLSAPGGDATIMVEAADLVAEPDSLETYPALVTFLQRQAAIYALLGADQVELQVRQLGSLAVETIVVEPRPPALWHLSDGFWVQLLTGIAGILISGWVWALRPRSIGPIMFALTAIGLLAATATSALYANRELAIDADAFGLMIAINHFGVLLFGLAMVGLLLSYPRQIVHPAWSLAIPLLTAAYVIADVNQLGLGPSQLYIFVGLAMLGIFASVGIQWWVTRNSPSDRAALGWLGLSVILGCGAFTILGAAPVLFDTPAGIPQSHVTGVLIIIYAGLALGVSRYRLFELGDWSYRILFYTIGAIILLLVDAGLIYLLNVESAPALGVSLIFVAFVYLPGRDWIWRKLTARRRIEQDELFSAALAIAFAPTPAAGTQHWRALLQRLFDPLEVEEIAPVAQPGVGGDGLTMLLPAVAGSPALRLSYPAGGRGLFSPANLKLATNLVSLTERAAEGREAYMRGVGEERRRMARDLHDDVGARLLTGLHTADAETRPTLQAALSDIRAIVSGLAGEEASLDRVLADIRHEAARRLEAADIALDWPLPEVNTQHLQLDYRLHKAITSAVREIVSNVIRHAGATSLSVAQSQGPGSVLLSFVDNGQGLPQAALDGDSAGYGLRNIRTRVEDVGGTLMLASARPGTAVTLTIPLTLSPRPPEPGVLNQPAALNSPA